MSTKVFALPLDEGALFPGMIIKLAGSSTDQQQNLQRNILQTVCDGSKKEVFVTEGRVSTKQDGFGFCEIGTIGKIGHFEVDDHGNWRAVITGQKRVEVASAALESSNDFHTVTAEDIPDDTPDEILQPEATVSLIEKVVRCINNWPVDIRFTSDCGRLLERLNSIKTGSKKASEAVAAIAGYIYQKPLFVNIDLQAILEEDSSLSHLEILSRAIEVTIDPSSYLSQEGLTPHFNQKQGSGGGQSSNEVEYAEYGRLIDEIPLSEEAHEKAESALERLARMDNDNPNADTLRNYLDWLLSMPWATIPLSNTDIAKAEGILEEDHYGLDQVKRKITTYLAILKRAEGKKGRILCFVGPPGTGKTSIARSIARATDREYVRMALGGVRDEGEIRGERRSYVGSEPGGVVKNMKKAGANNPVFLLDEIDKLEKGSEGNPASALLEVLDPEQNDSFRDRYLDVEYDLSSVLFICTANDWSAIPSALRDRMDLVEFKGYTAEEKFVIATKYIIKEVREEAGLRQDELSIDDEVFHKVIAEYTREAGVRGLKRVLTDIAGEVVKEIETTERKVVQVTVDNLEQYAGKSKILPREISKKHEVGLVTGLAWTEAGGDVLFMEAVTFESREFKVIATGQLGDVMGESVNVASSMIRSKAESFGIKKENLTGKEIHVHALDGAIPKDGPSAGVTLATAIYSILKNKEVRNDVAMTGEITLRGKVLPIGGVKEKIIAAKEAGIKTVLIPRENYERDLDELPESAQKLTIIPVDTIEDVYRYALVEGKELFPESSPEISRAAEDRPAAEP